MPLLQLTAELPGRQQQLHLLVPYPPGTPWTLDDITIAQHLAAVDAALRAIGRRTAAVCRETRVSLIHPRQRAGGQVFHVASGRGWELTDWMAWLESSADE